MLRIALVLMGSLLASCSNDEQPNTESGANGVAIGESLPALGPSLDASIRNILIGYLNQIDTDYNALGTELTSFENQVAEFLESPQLSTMNSLRKTGRVTASRQAPSTSSEPQK